MNVRNFQKYLFFNKAKIDLENAIEVPGAPTAGSGTSRSIRKLFADRALSSEFMDPPGSPVEIPSIWARDFFSWVLGRCAKETCRRRRVSFETGPVAFFRLQMATDVNPSFSTWGTTACAEQGRPVDSVTLLVCPFFLPLLVRGRPSAGVTEGPF